jgi:hypothetical protein
MRVSQSIANRNANAKCPTRPMDADRPKKLGGRVMAHDVTGAKEWNL